MQTGYKEIYLTAIIAGLFFIILVGIIVIAGYLYTKRRKMQILERAYFQQTLLQSQLEIQEQTLKNISQEIHDNIGQALTLVKLNLNTMDFDLNEQSNQKIITSKELISKAINDLRDLSRSLNTDIIADLGLQNAIEQELILVSKSSNLKTRFIYQGENFRISQQMELILFRIIQEALNNIMKHAEASEVSISVKSNLDTLMLEIADDGKGFNLKENAKGNIASLGLRNMSNRAKLIGANFIINSVVGKGTVLKIELHNASEKFDMGNVSGEA